MLYLQRLSARPSIDDLSERDARHVREHFDPYAGEVIIDGQAIRWNDIEEVEVAQAARMKSPAGWVVKNLIMGGERYHVGVYFGRHEAVLPNLTLEAVRYIVQSIAFYAPQRVAYSGPPDLEITPLFEV